MSHSLQRTATHCATQWVSFIRMNEQPSMPMSHSLLSHVTCRHRHELRVELDYIYTRIHLRLRSELHTHSLQVASEHTYTHSLQIVLDHTYTHSLQVVLDQNCTNSLQIVLDQNYEHTLHLIFDHNYIHSVLPTHSLLASLSHIHEHDSRTRLTN